jgi:hypothetical protein
MKKQRAPSAVHQFAGARARTDPVDGITKDATAEIPKKTHPARLTAAIRQREGKRVTDHGSSVAVVLAARIASNG